MVSGTLVVVGGLPGAGKSTLSVGVAAELDATYLRIDSLEQAIHDALNPPSIEAAGYLAAQAVAADNLRLGRIVVVDCVNPWMLTRDAFRDLAREADAGCVEVEVVCSDPVEHRTRVEGRAGDLPGLKLPTWQDVLNRDYRPWERERYVIDTAGRTANMCVEELATHVRDFVVGRRP